MQIKTNELTGAALDWAVAKCEGLTCFGHKLTEGILTIALSDGTYENFSSSRNWALGGPIIEREGIYLWRPYGVNGAWSATLDDWPAERVIHDDKPLIAAMRCYVASKLGDTVDIPEELV